MGDLILHIGSHKTGTTSIQKALKRGLQRQKESDPVFVNIPKVDRLTKSEGLEEEFRIGIRPKAADRLLAPRDQNIIMSDEGLFWLFDETEIEKICELIRTRFDSVRIICYLRRQDYLASSHRRQVIGARPASRFYGISASPLPEYRPHLQNYFDYAHKLNIWANALGKNNVVVSSFDEIRQRGVDIVEDFARKAKVSLSITANKNSSLSGNSTYLGLKLTEIGLDSDHIQDILDHVEGSSPFLPTKDEARAFLAHFADANERLARDWGLEFDMSFDRYPESADHRWSNADVDAMLNALLAELKKNKNQS